MPVTSDRASFGTWYSTTLWKSMNALAGSGFTSFAGSPLATASNHSVNRCALPSTNSAMALRASAVALFGTPFARPAPGGRGVPFGTPFPAISFTYSYNVKCNLLAGQWLAHCPFRTSSSMFPMTRSLSMSCMHSARSQSDGYSTCTALTAT